MSKGKELIIPLLEVMLFIALLQLMGVDTVLTYYVPLVGEIVSNPINYIGLFLVMFFIIIGYRDIAFPRAALLIYALLFVFFSVNYYLAPFALFTWYKYQVAFLLVSFFTCIVAYKNVQRRDYSLYVFGFALLYALLMFGFMVSTVGVEVYITDYNTGLRVLDSNFINEKQKFGNLLAFLILYVVFMIKDKRIQALTVMLLLFMGVGSRTLVIGLLGVYFILNYRSVYKPMLLGVPIFIGAGLILPDYFYIGNLVYGTRFYSYLNAAYIVQNYNFGVGIGGYKYFTETNNDLLLLRFYNSEALHLLLPAATESDIVYYVSSYGWLGVAQLLLFCVFCLLCASVFHKSSPLGKVFMSFFIFLVVAGISQDNAFSIFYWIAFGAAFGTYLSARVQNIPAK